jgi:hypothetical protein
MMRDTSISQQRLMPRAEVGPGLRHGSENHELGRWRG